MTARSPEVGTPTIIDGAMGLLPWPALPSGEKNRDGEEGADGLAPPCQQTTSPKGFDVRQLLASTSLGTMLIAGTAVARTTIDAPAGQCPQRHSQTGKLIVDETYVSADTDKDGDLDGPFAQGSRRFGVRTAGRFNGNIANGEITVKGKIVQPLPGSPRLILWLQQSSLCVRGGPSRGAIGREEEASAIAIDALILKYGAAGATSDAPNLATLRLRLRGHIAVSS